MGWQGTAVDIALLLMYVLRCPISHHLQNTSSEVKLVIKNFKMAASKELNEAWSPSEYEALCSCPDHMPEKAALLSISLCKHHHGTGRMAPWGLVFLVCLPHQTVRYLAQLQHQYLSQCRIHSRSSLNVCGMTITIRTSHSLMPCPCPLVDLFHGSSRHFSFYSFTQHLQCTPKNVTIWRENGH